MKLQTFLSLDYIFATFTLPVPGVAAFEPSNWCSVTRAKSFWCEKSLGDIRVTYIQIYDNISAKH